MKLSILFCIIVSTQLINGCNKGIANTNTPGLNIVSVNIPVNAVNVPVNSKISFTFNVPMSSSCGNCIVLKQCVNDSTFKPVSGIATTSGVDIVFTPQAQLLPDTRYYVEVSAAPNKDNNQIFFSDYSSHSRSSFFFTTGNLPNTSI